MDQVANDRLLRTARVVLKLFWIVNAISAAAFVAAAVLSLPLQPWAEAHLRAKYGPGADTAGMVAALRVLFVLGISGCGAAHVMLTRLLAIIRTVSAGDPFVVANARRLEQVGWALLAWQLLDAGLGGLQLWLARLGVDRRDWNPSLTGWVAVLLVFVLARVFRRGAQMRDELEGTV